MGLDHLAGFQKAGTGGVIPFSVYRLPFSVKRLSNFIYIESQLVAFERYFYMRRSAKEAPGRMALGPEGPLC
jgi:hypothetical protein